MICPLTDEPQCQSCCEKCMYYVPTRENTCVFKIEISPIEFAKEKGMSVDDMHKQASVIKEGIILLDYADYCVTNVPKETVVTNAATEAVNNNPLLRSLGISPELLQRMCNTSVWKDYKRKRNLNTKLSSVMPISKAEYLSILDEKENL